jgi:hypothetical protein
MITNLQIQGFKSWQDTHPIKMASLTSFFGANSSGKTAILQLLLMLKQTAESTDRLRVLHTGDELAYVDLGTFHDIAYGHKVPSSISFELDWVLPKPLNIADPDTLQRRLFRIVELHFEAVISGNADGIQVEHFEYSFQSGKNAFRFGMRQEENLRTGYEVITDGYEFKRSRGRPFGTIRPIKCYGFPDEVNAQYHNAGFLSELVLAFEQLFQGIHYLGPLREYPHRSYVWGGEPPVDVGRRGEKAVPALLAARARNTLISRGQGRKRQRVDERIAQWLRDFGMIDSFSLEPIAKNRRDYEVRVKRSPDATEVLITDVGFGVSQILPVLTLCYYAPEGSTIILEQPEIHLHPSVQAQLADVFIDAIKYHDVQILIESHSEHLLRRLQRRVAEGVISENDAALYFVINSKGKSQLQKLQLDLFGNIRNWPQNFFGDEIGDLVAMSEAAMKRQPNADKADNE